MTRENDFKTLVRARMARTGESYTTARDAMMRARDETDKLWARTRRVFLQDGRISSVPTKRKARLAILFLVLERFERGREYTEPQVNDLIRPLHEDYAFWRRELVDYGYLTRAGGVYRVADRLPERDPAIMSEVPGDEAARFRAATEPRATVIIIQHAEKRRGAGDVELTERGLAQAREVGDHVRAMHPARVVTSPLMRARQTAAAVSDEASVDDRLRERMNLEAGQDPDVFFSQWQQATQDRGFRPEGGDSSADCGDRMRAALEEHALEGELVVLVSHGGATVDLLRTLLGDDVLQAIVPGILTEGVPPAALTTLVRRGGVWTAESVASIAHRSSATTPE